MNIMKPVAEFGTVFVVALVATAVVTYLWNLIGYGESSIDSKDPTVQAQIKKLRDSGKIVHLYATLLNNSSTDWVCAKGFS